VDGGWVKASAPAVSASAALPAGSAVSASVRGLRAVMRSASDAPVSAASVEGWARAAACCAASEVV
jgi:hypothetical protein